VLIVVPPTVPAESLDWSVSDPEHAVAPTMPNTVTRHRWYRRSEVGRPKMQAEGWFISRVPLLKSSADARAKAEGRLPSLLESRHSLGTRDYSDLARPVRTPSRNQNPRSACRQRRAPGCGLRRRSAPPYARRELNGREEGLENTAAYGGESDKNLTKFS